MSTYFVFFCFLPSLTFLATRVYLTIIQLTKSALSRLKNKTSLYHLKSIIFFNKQISLIIVFTLNLQNKVIDGITHLLSDLVFLQTIFLNFLDCKSKQKEKKKPVYQAFGFSLSSFLAIPSVSHLGGGVCDSTRVCGAILIISVIGQP